MLKKFKLNTNNLNFEHMYSQKYKILYECIKSFFFYKCHKTDDLKKKEMQKVLVFPFLFTTFSSNPPLWSILWTGQKN